MDELELTNYLDYRFWDGLLKVKTSINRVKRVSNPLQFQWYMYVSKI